MFDYQTQMVPTVMICLGLLKAGFLQSQRLMPTSEEAEEETEQEEEAHHDPCGNSATVTGPNWAYSQHDDGKVLGHPNRRTKQYFLS